MKELIANVKDVFALLREVAILVALGLLIGCPTQTNTILSNAGITSINTSIFEWKEQVKSDNAEGKAAAQSLSTTVQSIQDATSALQKAESQSNDPAVKQLVAAAIQSLGGTLSSAQNADQSLRQNIAAQQTILQGTEGHSKNQSLSGWIYVGAVDEAKLNWKTDSPKGLAAGTPVPQKGKPVTLTLTDDVYVRGDPPSGDHYNAAPILGVIRSGATIQVTDVGYSHALAGGDFLWLKVNAQ